MSAGGAAAAAAAAMIQAVRASGVIVRVEPDGFQDILTRIQGPLIVQSTGGLFRKNYQYLTSYKGLAFYTKSSEEIPLPRSAEVIFAKSIWVPG